MDENYRKALKQGEHDCKRAMAEGHHPYLMALDAVMGDDAFAGEKRLGTFEIPLDQVIGTRTEGRQVAFSRTFMPLLGPQTEFAQKWSNLYEIQVTEGFRDPVKAYEFLHRFYVLEGNKRTSVLKYLGGRSIEAEVIRLIPKEADEEGLRVYEEFEQFWDVARLYEIDFTRPGSYAKLAGYLGQDLEHPWPAEVVRRLRSTYYFFEEMFHRAGGSHLDITPSDALLIYLGFFGQDQLLETPSSIVLDRLHRIWDELAFQGGGSEEAEEEKVVLVGEPKAASSGLLSSVLSRLPQASAKPLVCAFIHEGRSETSEWTRAHEEGRKEVAEKLSGIIETRAYEGCATEDQVAAAIQDACSQGAQVIFTTSPVLMQATVKEAVMHPDVQFLNCSITLPHQVVRSYYGRMYEAKYILGALAASLSEDHRLIYHAHVPVFGTVAEIDAFALGASLIDPKAKILLSWSRRGEDAAQAFTQLGPWTGKPLISGNDMTPPADEPSAYGLYTLDGGKVEKLAAPVWMWGRYYELILKSLLQGALPQAFQDGSEQVDLPKNVAGGQAMSYWYGLSSGVISLALSPKLPTASRRLVGLLARDIKAGTLKPFTGAIVRQDGSALAGDDLTAAQIVSIDWLCQNIEGRLPEGWKPAESALPDVPSAAKGDESR